MTSHEPVYFQATESTETDDPVNEPISTNTSTTPMDDVQGALVPSTSTTDTNAGPASSDANDLQDGSRISPPPSAAELTEATNLAGMSSALVAANASKEDQSAWPEWMHKHMPKIGDPSTNEFGDLLMKFAQLEASLGFPKGQVSPDAK